MYVGKVRRDSEPAPDVTTALCRSSDVTQQHQPTAPL